MSRRAPFVFSHAGDTEKSGGKSTKPLDLDSPAAGSAHTIAAFADPAQGGVDLLDFPFGALIETRQQLGTALFTRPLLALGFTRLAYVAQIRLCVLYFDKQLMTVFTQLPGQGI